MDVPESDVCACVEPAVRVVECGKGVDDVSVLFKVFGVAEVVLDHVEKFFSCEVGDVEVFNGVFCFVKGCLGDGKVGGELFFGDGVHRNIVGVMF